MTLAVMVQGVVLFRFRMEYLYDSFIQLQGAFLQQKFCFTVQKNQNNKIFFS